MLEGKQYAKIIEWSEDLRCYVGICPDLKFEAKGSSETQVLNDLNSMIKSEVKRHTATKEPMPQKRFYASRVFMF